MTKTARRYTFHDSICGWEEGRIGYARQVAAERAAAARKLAKRPLTREEQMDLNAARSFAEMDRVNAEVREFTRKIMLEPGPKFEPQPSSQNEPWRGFIDANGEIRQRRRGFP